MITIEDINILFVIITGVVSIISLVVAIQAKREANKSSERANSLSEIVLYKDEFVSFSQFMRECENFFGDGITDDVKQRSIELLKRGRNIQGAVDWLSLNGIIENAENQLDEQLADLEYLINLPWENLPEEYKLFTNIECLVRKKILREQNGSGGTFSKI